MKVMSLFDGMSCGQLALERAGIEYSEYYASEIDSVMRGNTTRNFPDTIHVGDVLGWRTWGVDWASIDLLIGGSPCQGFSMSGAGRAFKDERSMLFFTYLDILNHIKSRNPRVMFMLENVKMSKVNEDVISEALGVAPVLLNSDMVSAQHRERLYWCSWDVSAPPDLGITLGSVAELKEVAHQPEWTEHKVRGRRSNLLQIAKYGDNSQCQRLYSSEGKHPCLCANRTGGPKLPFIEHDGVIGKMNLASLCRLQNVQAEYFSGVSETAAIQALGNGWTVNLISHLLSQIPPA